MNDDDHIDRSSTGRRQPTRMEELLVVSLWGFDEIRRLVAWPWDSIRDFAVRALGQGLLDVQLLMRRLDWLETWPWQKPFDVLAYPVGGQPLPDTENWSRVLELANIFSWPMGPKLRERSRGHKLLRQAWCIKAGRSVAECIESMLGCSVAEHLERKYGRALTAEQREFCQPPRKICGEYEEAIAAASVAYGERTVELEGYYWLWVRAELLGALRRFDRVLNAIRHDRVPDQQDLRALEPEPKLVVAIDMWPDQTEDGRDHYVLLASHVWPNYSDWALNWAENTIPGYLLAPATFEVMQQVDRYFRERGPAFVVTCRNPLCGKQFYSRDSRVVVCPKPSRSEADRSPCKRIWDAYRKFLQKIGKNPDTDWSDEKLRGVFLASYQPRGSQSRLR